MAFESLSEKLQAFTRKLKGQSRINEKELDEMLREVKLALLEADVNYKVVKEFVKEIHDKALGQDVLKSLTPGQQVVKIVKDELIELLGGTDSKIAFSQNPPTIIMLIGLQGSGKTTTAGKLANLIRKQGKKPLLVGLDIYRPAAIDQLETIGKQLSIPVFADRNAKDVSRVAKQAKEVAISKLCDTIILDTAGRLQIDEKLMQELKDIKLGVHPHEIMLVVDSMTVTGKPIKFIGTGEKLNEFEEFHPDRMASRILGMGDVLSIIEQAEETLSHEEAERFEKKLMKNKELDLNDYLAQLKQIKKMGPLSSIMKLIPGMGQYADKVDDRELVKVESIICSMTNEERENPRILNGQRRLRIAKGSGTQVQDINKFMQAFETTRDMMKKVSKGKIDPKMKKMMKSMNLDQLSEEDIEDLEKKLGKK